MLWVKLQPDTLGYWYNARSIHLHTALCMSAEERPPGCPSPAPPQEASSNIRVLKISSTMLLSIHAALEHNPLFCRRSRWRVVPTSAEKRGLSMPKKSTQVKLNLTTLADSTGRDVWPQIKMIAGFMGANRAPSGSCCEESVLELVSLHFRVIAPPASLPPWMVCRKFKRWFYSPAWRIRFSPDLFWAFNEKWKAAWAKIQ